MIKGILCSFLLFKQINKGRVVKSLMLLLPLQKKMDRNFSEYSFVAIQLEPFLSPFLPVLPALLSTFFFSLKGLLEKDHCLKILIFKFLFIPLWFTQQEK